MGYRLQAGSIHFSRAVYALNWFVMAPSLIYISSDLSLQLLQLGVITTGFYAGLAAFQLIGGILASRIGNAHIAISGLAILGISTVFSGLSYNLVMLLVSRVFAGIGAALFFSPGIGALSNIVPIERFGTHVGIYNGAFNIGAGVGIFGWSILDEAFGWRPSLIFSGVLAIALAIENVIALRGIMEVRSVTRDIPRKIISIIKKPHIWILSLAGLSSIIGETLIGQFFVYYAENVASIPSFTAGLMAGVSMVIGIAGGIIGGKQIQKTAHKGRAFFLTMVIGGTFIALIPVTYNVILLMLILIAEGLFVVAGFSVLYTMVSMEIADRSMVSFSLSLTNSIQMGFSIALPVIFTSLAYFLNYSDAWVIAGALAIATSGIIYVGRYSSALARFFPGS